MAPPDPTAPGDRARRLNPAVEEGPCVALLQSAVATLMARYALHRQDCIAAAVERAFLTLARHPQVSAQAACAYETLALAWRELSALNPGSLRH